MLRVLVKPYKEKGKVPDKYRKLQGDRVDFSCCSSPSVLDSRHHYDLQQIGARMLYRGSNQDAVLRRKLEEQQELQQAIELQSRRFMGLQLLNLNINPPASNSASALSPTLLPVSTAIGSSTSLGGENGLGPGSYAAPAAISRAEATSPKDDADSQESPDHNLPDSPFASPTKSTVTAGESFSLFSETDTTAASTSASVLLSSTLLPATSTLENMASFKSCFFQMPRLSSGPGAVGLRQ
ncbi:hypothetical protein HPP92_001470 [Vanilla planifolia]|uniref:Uncharacterized protein n=1 Tax=Vanilla planifolia TaxID=51239 RepID=A0A835VLK4_VANPL|nr:hypothetical protein HPP92_001470 [Vanilla planifolia]